MTAPSLPARRLMNDEQLKLWIYRQLGAPLLKVEIHPSQMDDVIEDTKDWFIGIKGITRNVMIEVASGIVAYDVPDDVDVPLEIYFPAPPYDFSVVFSPYILADEQVPYDVFAAPESAGIYSSLAQAIQYTEMAKRILSADDNWIWDETLRQIILSPSPRNSGQMLVRYRSNSLTIEQLPQYDYNMVKRYALASAKIALGRIRSKYAGFPGAQGERQLDGRDLIQEGNDEIERLDEELRDSCLPVPIITG